MYDILIAIVGNSNYQLLEAVVEDMDVTKRNSPVSSDRPSVLNYAVSHNSPPCIEVLMKRSINTAEEDCLVRTTDQDVTSSLLLAASLDQAEAFDVILRLESFTY